MKEGGILRRLDTKKPMSGYIDNTWGRQPGRYLIAKAIAPSENVRVSILVTLVSVLATLPVVILLGTLSIVRRIFANVSLHT